MRSLAALAVVAALAGCANPPEQTGAEQAAARAAGTEHASCTARSRIWFSEGPPAKVFVCTVKVDNGFCDRYRVDRSGGRYRARILERRTGCARPVG